jgi:hypothetical protein
MLHVEVVFLNWYRNHKFTFVPSCGTQGESRLNDVRQKNAVDYSDWGKWGVVSPKDSGSLNSG